MDNITVRKGGYVFVTWDQSFRALFTRQQLKSMHLHFIHLATSKLYSLLERLPQEIDSKTWELLKIHQSLSMLAKPTQTDR
jgi:hypothetical protein